MSWANRVKTAAPTNGAPAAPAPAAAAPSSRPTGSSSSSGPRSVLNYLLSNLRGSVVTVELVTGSHYEGVYHSAQLDGQTPAITIKECQLLSQQHIRKTAAPNSPHGGDYIPRNTNPFIDSMVFPLSDISQVRASEVAFGAAGGIKSKQFATDTEISQKSFQERELVPWSGPSHTIESSASSLSLDGSTGEFDQFATFERMTNKQSDFNFDDYSTRLDRDSEFYKENEAKAEALARLIKNEPTANIHMALERGQLNESEIDEDKHFSTVIRDDSVDGEGSAGKYKIPARRAGDAPPPPKQEKKGKENKPAQTENKKEEKKAEPKAAEQPQKVEEKKEAPAAAPAPVQPAAQEKKEDAAAADAASEEKKPKSKLNPKAKEFVLSAAAKEFVPGGFSAPAVPTVPPMMNAPGGGMPVPGQFPPPSAPPGQFPLGIPGVPGYFGQPFPFPGGPMMPQVGMNIGNFPGPGGQFVPPGGVMPGVGMNLGMYPFPIPGMFPNMPQPPFGGQVNLNVNPQGRPGVPQQFPGGAPFNVPQGAGQGGAPAGGPPQVQGGPQRRPGGN